MSGFEEYEKSVRTSFEKHLEEHPEIRLASEEEAAALKIKAGKSHIRESDWEEIEAFLSGHDVIVFRPSRDTVYMKARENMCIYRRHLLVFTNLGATLSFAEYLLMLHARAGQTDIGFTFGTMPFSVAVQAANEAGMNLCIDEAAVQGEPFLKYTCEDRSLSVMMY